MGQSFFWCLLYLLAFSSYMYINVYHDYILYMYQAQKDRKAQTNIMIWTVKPQPWDQGSYIVNICDGYYYWGSKPHLVVRSEPMVCRISTISLSMFMLSFIFCDSTWGFWVEVNLCRFFFIICLHMYYHWRSSYQEGRGRGGSH